MAARCVDFFVEQVATLERGRSLRILELVFQGETTSDNNALSSIAKISAVMYPKEYSSIAKTFWQHTGDGVSSRRAEFCHRVFGDGHLTQRNSSNCPIESQRLCKGPRRYQRGGSFDQSHTSASRPENDDLRTLGLRNFEGKEYMQFVEERFGRNMETSLAAKAKLAIRRRIAGALIADVDLYDALEMPGETTRVRQVQGFSEDDVYLHPTGMSSIYNAHRTLMATRGAMKSVCFG